MSAKKPTFVGKLSTKNILHNKRPNVPEKDGEVNYLYDVVGVAGSVKAGQGDYGPWNKFIGSFQSTNHETGEVLRSGACFLPAVAENLVLGALSNVETTSVQFAFKIGVVKDDKAARGYIFVAEPILPPAENDPLEQLTKQVLRLEHQQEATADTPKKKSA